MRSIISRDDTLLEVVPASKTMFYYETRLCFGMTYYDKENYYDEFERINKLIDSRRVKFGEL